MKRIYPRSRYPLVDGYQVTYRVTCPVCGFQHEIDEVDAVFDFQEEHREQYGEHHLLEFELIQ